MSAASIEERITALLAREGGYVDHAEDSGGPTNHGITQAKLSGWRRRPVSAADVQALSEAEAREIYRADYRAAQLDIAPDAVEDLLLDIYTNHGPGNYTLILQRALGVAVDGRIGPKTRAALAAANGPRLFLRLCAERMRFTGRAITKNLKDDNHDGIPDHTRFAWGWLDRQAGFVENAPLGGHAG